MGIQSTREISRQVAEQMWVTKKLDELEAKFKREVRSLPDLQLEDEIEDEFDNYRITEGRLDG